MACFKNGSKRYSRFTVPTNKKVRSIRKPCSPRLFPKTEICGTSETHLTTFDLPCTLTLSTPSGAPQPSHLELQLRVCFKKELCHTVDESFECMPSGEQNPCIYRVPALITNLNPKDYQPHVVSFGPYHHYDDHLRPMEEHKHRACLCFLQRSQKSLELFLGHLRTVEGELKDSYDALHPEWKEGMGDQFMELMITDGCFMLEIMLAARMEKNDYAPNDPIFSTHRLAYITPYIRRDMLMLGNQLPILVLYQLFAVAYDSKEADKFINELILSFYSLDTDIPRMDKCLHVLDVFRKGLLKDPKSGKGDKSFLETCIPGMGHVVDVFRNGLCPKKDQQEIKNAEPGADECDKSFLETCIPGMGHVVDIFRNGLRPKKDQQEIKNAEPGADECDKNPFDTGIKVIENIQRKIIRSATELDEAGIRFKKSNTISLKDISFARGELQLPAITVDDAIKSNFLNVMTFERLHIGAGTEVTSYAIFMDNIINNERDVALLHAEGIIQNDIGSNEKVAELFNSLCKEVTLASDDSLEIVQNKISEHCERRWNQWRAKFNRTYFKNPWTILSLTAAIFLFALTIIQTVYAVLDYY